MILWVLRDIPAAPDSSRPAGSIGDVKFNIRIDYISQKTPQSINFLHHPGRQPDTSSSSNTEPFEVKASTHCLLPAKAMICGGLVARFACAERRL